MSPHPLNAQGTHYFGDGCTAPHGRPDGREVWLAAIANPVRTTESPPPVVADPEVELRAKLAAQCEMWEAGGTSAWQHTAARTVREILSGEYDPRRP